MKKLTDICDIQYGYAFDSKKFTEDNSYPPIVRIRDIKRGFSETYYSGEYPKQYVLHAGDLLVGMDGEFNIARWKDVDALLNQRVCKLTAKEGTHEEYLRFAMIKSLKAIEDKTAFVTVKHLSAKELNKLELNVPSFREQDNVAKILTKLEKLILLREEELKSLDKIIKARFVEMFGDVKINPHNYKKFSIKSVLKSCEAGWSGNGTQRIRKDDEIAVLKVSAVTKGYFIPEECKVLDDQENIKKYVIPEKGDLLFSRANTREMVGATAIVKEDYPSLILPDKLWKIKFKDNVNVIYMKYILSSKSVRNQFSAVSTGTSGSMYNVSMDQFKGIEIPIPPIELQNQFADFVRAVDKSKVIDTNIIPRGGFYNGNEFCISK